MGKFTPVFVMALVFALPSSFFCQEASPVPTPPIATQAEILAQQKEIVTKQKDLIEAQRAYLEVFRQASASGISDREKSGGRTEFTAETGTVFETVILSYDALREISTRIEEKLGPAVSRYDRIAIYYEPDFAALSRYRLYREQARIAIANYEAFIKQLNEEAARAQQNKDIQTKSVDDNRGTNFLTGLSAPSIATAAVRSVAELVSLFRTDRVITTSTVAIKQEVPGMVIAGDLMRAHPNLAVYNPEMFVPEYDIGIGDKRSFYEEIARLNAAEAFLGYFLDESSRLPEKIQNTPPLTLLIARAKVVRVQISGLSFSLKTGQLNAAEQTDNTEFRRMVRAEKLDHFLKPDIETGQSSRVGIVKISLLSSGGSRRESKNLILGSKTDYSGSAVVEVAIYDVDGTLRASEIYTYHTGFRKFKAR